MKYLITNIAKTEVGVAAINWNHDQSPVFIYCDGERMPDKYRAGDYYCDEQACLEAILFRHIRPVIDGRTKTGDALKYEHFITRERIAARWVEMKMLEAHHAER